MKRWIPQQHGAWAMLAVPTVIGSVRAYPQGHIVVMVLTWWFGYFAYAAASRWLKTCRKRRAPYVAPLLVYSLCTLVSGVATVATAGLSVLLWSLVMVPLLAISLWLVATGRERSLANGVITVAAATILLPALVHPWMVQIDGDLTLAIISCLTGTYFGGTIYAVKAMIRRRGDDAWWFTSLAYHTGALALVLTLTGISGWLLLAFAWLARAALFPWLQRQGMRIKPLYLGLVEIALCIWLVVLALH